MEGGVERLCGGQVEWRVVLKDFVRADRTAPLPSILFFSITVGQPLAQPLPPPPPPLPTRTPDSKPPLGTRSERRVCLSLCERTMKKLMQARCAWTQEAKFITT